MAIFAAFGTKILTTFMRDDTFPLYISDLLQSSSILIGAVILQIVTIVFINVHYDLVRRIEIWQRCVTLGGFTEGQVKECVGGIVFKRINRGELRI